MANYKVRVSRKLRGELAIPIIKRGTLLPGRLIDLDEEQYNSWIIKSAIAKGFLVDESVLPKTKKNFATTKKQKTKKPEEITEIEATKEEIEMSTKEPVRKIKTKKMSKIERTIAEARKELANMVAWDAEGQKGLDPEQSKQLALEQINSSKAEVQVQTRQIDFSDDKEDVPLNAQETQKAILHKRQRGPATVVTANANDITSIKKRGRKPKSLTPVGEIKPEPKAEDVDKLNFDISPPDISFVDDEQTKERIRNHPIISKKIAEQNEEVN